jgi:hypothetical protein
MSSTTCRPKIGFSESTSAARELVRFLVLFVIDLRTRTVEIAGIVRQPDGDWMKQIARNLTDAGEGFLRNARHLIHDHRRILAHAVIGSFQGRHIDEMCQRVEPSFGFSLRSFHYLQQFR